MPHIVVLDHVCKRFYLHLFNKLSEIQHTLLYAFPFYVIRYDPFWR